MLRIKRVPVSNQSQKGKYIFPSHPFSKQTYCPGQSFNSLSSWLNCSELSKGGAINYERLTEVWVTEITKKSERKKTNIGVNIIDMVELCQCFWKKKYFWMSNLRDTCHNIYIILFTLSEWYNHPWHLPMMPDCDWFNFIPWFQHIFIFRKYQNTPAAFGRGIYHSDIGQFSPLRTHTVDLLAWHIAHFNTSIHQTCVQEKHTGNVYCTNLLNNPHVDKQTQKNTMHYK